MPTKFNIQTKITAIYHTYNYFNVKSVIKIIFVKLINIVF